MTTPDTLPAILMAPDASDTWETAVSNLIGMVAQCTTISGETSDVIIRGTKSLRNGYLGVTMRRFDEALGDATGPTFTLETSQIKSLYIY